MKKIIFTAAVIGFTACTTTSAAQDDKGDKGKKETQEIIIRKKGDKDTRITVEIKGDKVTINGKPLAEFKDDEITINKRNMIIRDGRGNTRIQIAPGDLDGMNFWNDDSEESSAFLGVTTSAFNDGSKDAKPQGAAINDVSKGSAAEKAGLKNGDVITRINDKKVDGPETLSDVVTSFKPNDEVTVYFNRDGKESTAKAILGERKGTKAMTYTFSGPDGMARTFTMPRIPNIPDINNWKDKERGDVSPRVWTPEGGNYDFFTETYPRQQKLGLKIQDTEDGNGVKVLDVEKDSPAEKAGLRKDDVVTEIGGNKVSNSDEAREQLHETQDRSSYNIKANRNGNSMSFDIKIPKKLKTANL